MKSLSKFLLLFVFLLPQWSMASDLEETRASFSTPMGSGDLWSLITGHELGAANDPFLVFNTVNGGLADYILVFAFYNDLGSCQAATTTNLNTEEVCKSQGTNPGYTENYTILSGTMSVVCTPYGTSGYVRAFDAGSGNSTACHEYAVSGGSCDVAEALDLNNVASCTDPCDAQITGIGDVTACT